jgi:HAD superfamily hydrolase (TIGR01549 family)
MVDQCQRQEKFSGLLFDLDGTLLDSFDTHFEAYRIMLSRFSIEMSEEIFLASYSPNWYRTYQAFGLPEDVWEVANSYWMEAIKELTPKLFPGVSETLAGLSNSYELGIVTSGSKNRVLRDLESTGIKSFFQVAITGDDIKRPKPDPEGLELALSKMKLLPGEAVYIGDAHADYEMAQAANVHFLGIPSAFASLDSGHPCRKLQSITDLLKLFG